MSIALHPANPFDSPHNPCYYYSVFGEIPKEWAWQSVMSFGL